MDKWSFPFFDGHVHFSQAYLDEILDCYAKCGVGGGLNLWNEVGNAYKDYAGFLRLCKKKGLFARYAQFYWPDWTAFGWQPKQFVSRLCREMRKYNDMGAVGLKVWKDLGMMIHHNDGTPAVMDDERLEPVWKTAEDLKWCIAVHQADPAGYFEEHTRSTLTRKELWQRRDNVISAHPNIQWILCHSGNDVDTVEDFAAELDKFPTLRSDLRRLYLLGGAEKVRPFLEKYADRLYIGVDLTMPKDRPPDVKWTYDEVYSPWRDELLSLGLSKEAFEKITWANGFNHFLKQHQ